MKKGFTLQRKMSAIVALALAAVVTFTAGLNSYGVPKNEDFIVYDINASIERAYEDVIEEEFVIEDIVPVQETIKIFNSDDELLETIVLGEGDVVEDDEAKRLLNRADYLSSFGSTSVYKIAD